MIKRNAVVITIALAATACSSGTDEATGTTAPVTTTPATTAENVATTDTTNSDATATGIGEDESHPAPTTDSTAASSVPASTAVPPAESPPAPDPVCPAPAQPQVLESVDSTGRPIPAEGEGVTPGRHATEKLGVSVAFDVDEALVDGFVFGSTIGFFDQFGSNSVSMHRTADFVLSTPSREEMERGAEPTTGAFDDWLMASGVDVISDETIEIDGLPAREVQLIAPNDAADTFDQVRLTAQWGILPHDTTPKRLVHIELPVGEPLTILVDADDAESAGAAAANNVISTLAIGEVGLAPDNSYADTPWDVGNTFEGVLVGACTIPSLALGGIQFDLQRPAIMHGQGNRLWLLDERQQHTALISEPEVRILQTSFGMIGGDFTGPPSIGGPIATVADAVAQFEERGYTVTPIEGAATLLGEDAQTFEFVSPDSDPFVFQPGNNAASDGNGFLSFNAGTEGIMHIAELDDGVLIVSIEGEQGTDDIELLRDQFESIVETLRYQS